MNDYFDNWIVQARKGLVEVCVLRALAGRECYGYELVKTLVDVPGLGLSEGTLYPLLSRLRVQGLVTTRLEESTEGPARKYYTLTAEGRRGLTLMEDYLDTLNAGTRSLRKKGI
jgi:PadR family transcriptional regulator PadR